MGKSTPKAPDPNQTAQAQAKYNQDTAQLQQQMNMVGTSGPWGSTSYNQTGTTSYVGADGRMVSVPQFTQTTTLSPTQQAIFDQQQAAMGNLSSIANQQSQRVSSTLSDPFKFDNQATADWIYDMGASRIAPQQQQNEDRLRTQLINSGLRPGTAAWDSEMTRMTQANNDQWNQLALQGRGQAFNEQLAVRNQPLNELNSLLGQSQVANPNQMAGATPQTSVGGVDYSGLVQNNYQNQVSAHNAKWGAIGGMFGLAGQALMASDERLKTDIERVGTLDNGLPVYSYRYKSGGPIHIGLMAQDVEKVNPDAVGLMDNGFKGVYYAKAVL